MKTYFPVSLYEDFVIYELAPILVSMKKNIENDAICEMICKIETMSIALSVE